MNMAPLVVLTSLQDPTPSGEHVQTAIIDIFKLVLGTWACMLETTKVIKSDKRIISFVWWEKPDFLDMVGYANNTLSNCSLMIMPQNSIIDYFCCTKFYDHGTIKDLQSARMNPRKKKSLLSWFLFIFLQVYISARFYKRGSICGFAASLILMSKSVAFLSWKKIGHFLSKIYSSWGVASKHCWS